MQLLTFSDLHFGVKLCLMFVNVSLDFLSRLVRKYSHFDFTIYGAQIVVISFPVKIWIDYEYIGFCSLNNGL